MANQPQPQPQNNSSGSKSPRKNLFTAQELLSSYTERTNRIDFRRILTQRLNISTHHLDLSVPGEIRLHVGEESRAIEVDSTPITEWGTVPFLSAIINTYSMLLTRDYIRRHEETSEEEIPSEQLVFMETLLSSASSLRMWESVAEARSDKTLGLSVANVEPQDGALEN